MTALQNSCTEFIVPYTSKYSVKKMALLYFLPFSIKTKRYDFLHRLIYFVFVCVLLGVDYSSL